MILAAALGYVLIAYGVAAGLRRQCARPLAFGAALSWPVLVVLWVLAAVVMVGYAMALAQLWVIEKARQGAAT